jgi:hypothetical protein
MQGWSLYLPEKWWGENHAPEYDVETRASLDGMSWLAKQGGRGILFVFGWWVGNATFHAAPSNGANHWNGTFTVTVINRPVANGDVRKPRLFLICLQGGELFIAERKEVNSTF